MAESDTQKQRRTPAKAKAADKHDGEDQATDAVAAGDSPAELPVDATDPAGATPVAAAPEQGDTGDGAPPAPPAPPLGAQEVDGPSVDPNAKFSHARLAARADQLLGVSGAIVQGVLAGAPDPITFTDAQNRISEFLNAPVVNTDETDEEA